MDLERLLGDETAYLLDHKATAFPAELLTLPGPDHLERVFVDSDRPPAVVRSLAQL